MCNKINVQQGTCATRSQKLFLTVQQGNVQQGMCNKVYHPIHANRLAENLAKMF